MSLAAAQAFRQRLNAEPSLREPFLYAYEQSAEAVIALGHAQGFDFTEAELDEELSSIAPESRTPFEQQFAQDIDRRMRGELNDHELELVSAGGTPACNPAQSQSGAAKA
jgi:predicted ribosomally synthesized peptide with nif11-like leader